MALVPNAGDGTVARVHHGLVRQMHQLAAERIQDLLSTMEKSISKNAGKATVADFIRLTQLERELGQDEQPGKVVVTWKESTEKKK